MIVALGAFLLSAGSFIAGFVLGYRHMLVKIDKIQDRP